MRRFLVSLALIISAASITDAAENPPLRIDAQGTLLRNGEPYRAIGINYFNAFLRRLNNPDDTSYREGYAQLAEYNIPFVRFAACGFVAH